MLNKKGITPLIASILLIGFTVVLASIIFTWGDKLTEGLLQTSEERAEKNIACFSDINLKFRKAEIIEDNKIRLLVENNGQENIDKFNARIYGENGADNINTSESINSYEIKDIELDFNFLKTGNVNEVEIFLSTTHGNACVVCSNVE